VARAEPAWTVTTLSPVRVMKDIPGTGVKTDRAHPTLVKMAAAVKVLDVGLPGAGAPQASPEITVRQTRTTAWGIRVARAEPAWTVTTLSPVRVMKDIPGTGVKTDRAHPTLVKMAAAVKVLDVGLPGAGAPQASSEITVRQTRTTAWGTPAESAEPASTGSTPSAVYAHLDSPGTGVKNFHAVQIPVRMEGCVNLTNLVVREDAGVRRDSLAHTAR